MSSPVFSGAQDLHGEKEQVICNSVLKPLFAYLCSNSEVSLSKGLQIKCCVLSLDHSLEHDSKRRPLKRPPPDDHLVGTAPASLREIHETTTSNHRSLIVIPLGTPEKPQLFKD